MFVTKYPPQPLPLPVVFLVDARNKMTYNYLRILPQCSKVTVENSCCARLPLSIPNNERRVGHIEDYTKELL